jgi:amino acid adenylation domain-containing protein
MTVKEQIVPTRSELTGSQRALLEERLKRGRQAAARQVEARPAIPRRPSDSEIPLSFAQQRLWFLDQLEPGSAVYNVCQAVRMHGVLNPAALEQALNEVVRRHEVLRTNFVAVDGRPVQVITALRVIAMKRVDLTEGRSGSPAAELEQLLKEEARRPFDLSRDMLMRALLVRTAPNEHTLLLTLHHIISDGWSVGILFREMAALYQAVGNGEPAGLPDLSIQYADYACWERDGSQGQNLEPLLAYWRKQLQGPLPVLELPVDHPRTASPLSRGAAQAVSLPRNLTQEIKTIGQQEGATLFMTLLAAFQVLLYRWTGQDDIVVGSVVAGRRKVELEKLIGFFVNTLVFRGDLSGEPTFRQLLVRIRDMAVGALAHQDLPFERLVNELRPDRTVSRNPLFQAMFVLQNAPMAPTSLPGLQLEPVEVDTDTSKFDLTLSVMEGSAGLRAAMEYNADLFESDTIARLLASFETLLEGIVANPDQPISRLPLLTPAESRRIVTEWNDTRTEYPRDATIAELFAAQVARAPHAPAVTFGDRRLTYLQVDAEANRLAHWLRRVGVGPDTLVAVSLERSLELIIALLGIIKAGGTYVSLDPTYPAERLAYMLRDTNASVILTQSKLRGTVDDFVRAHRTGAGTASADAAPGERELRPATVLCVDTEWSRIAAEPDTAPACEVTPERLAYVSYTSGSTGQPKGVCVPHRGVVRLVRNTNYATLGPDEVILQFAPIAFDASTFEIWGALLNGGHLVVYPPGLTSLAELGEFIERHRVTTLWLTAGLFHQMVEEQLGRLRNVRQLLAGGDVLSPTHVARVLQQLPGTRLINGYGPTENTTFTCCHSIVAPPTAGRSVPIGRPIANTQVYILDRNLQPVPVGVPGELYAGGDGLARGYLNRPDLTAERFIPNPLAGANASAANSATSEIPNLKFEIRGGSAAAPAAPRLYRTGDRARWRPDGTIEFLGRIDRQVKIRGFRVEPAEIETVLSAHPLVKECAVVVRDGPAADKRLVAYIVPARDPAPSPDTWRKYLGERLPEYLVPSGFFTLPTLPLNANGKLDPRALPDDGGRPDMHGEYVAPRDDVERQLAGIWEDVLNVRPIGIRDQFFALGGHSLLAVRMVAQLEKTFGRKLPVAAIFQHRTVEQLARLVRGSDAAYTPTSSIVEIRGEGSRPRLYLVHGVGGGMFWGYSNLARHLGPDQPLYAFKSRGLDGLPEWPTIEQMAASYIADLRVHQPRGPYLLGGYCFGGIVAYEMACQLAEQGEEVQLLALINGSPPNTSYQKDCNRWSPAWQLRFLGNFAYWLSCFLFRWTWQERKEFVRWKLRILRRRKVEPGTQNHAEVALGDVDQLIDLAAYSEERRALWRAHVKGLMQYQPRAYHGRITLIRTRGHPLFCSFDPQYGWGELARDGVDVKIVRGGHGNVLAEPYVESVARALQPCLDEAAARQTAGGLR